MGSDCCCIASCNVFQISLHFLFHSSPKMKTPQHVQPVCEGSRRSEVTVWYQCSPPYEGLLLDEEALNITTIQVFGRCHGKDNGSLMVFFYGDRKKKNLLHWWPLTTMSLMASKPRCPEVTASNTI